MTRGLVTSSEYHCKVIEGRAELFFISGVGNDPFAIVFTVENSSASDIIDIVGMVSGGFTQNACLKIKETQKGDRWEKFDKREER